MSRLDEMFNKIRKNETTFFNIDDVRFMRKLNLCRTFNYTTSETRNTQKKERKKKYPLECIIKLIYHWHQSVVDHTFNDKN